jgi:hypothetical protein
MDPFSAHLDRGILRLRWKRGVEITHAHAVAAARALAEFHGPTALPLLVHMHGITGITPEARVGMAAYRGFSRVAIVGEDVVDEVMSGFSHRSPTVTRYFCSETEALAWLLDGSTAGQATQPASRD